jgi:hypothetical protein
MSDEKFQEFLEREAKAYNTPPATTPRDEMWAGIAAARAARRSVAVPSIAPHATRRPMRRYAPWIGMAATLLIGVGIGRFALQRDAAAPLSSVASTPSAATPTADATDVGTDAVAPANSIPVESPSDAPATRSVPAMRAPALRLAAATPNGSAPSAMQLASREHLTRAEALVSVVATTPGDAVLDSLTGRWAREMLTNTRLLLDSPAGEDPVRRRLLEDLETVLVQMVQRSGAATEERELIDRTLERTQLLTRLRSSVTGT